MSGATETVRSLLAAGWARRVRPFGPGSLARVLARRRWRRGARVPAGETFEFPAEAPVRGFTCLACRSEAQGAVFARVTAAQMPDGRADWVLCPNCGSANAPDLFPPDYEDDQPISPSALKYYIEQNAGVDVLAGLVAAVRRTGATRILDVGCGYGFLMDYARGALGWEVQGVDPSTFAREGRNRLGLPIASEYLTGENAERYAADVIVCSEIIEHLPDPDPFLGVLMRAMRPGGALVLTTPSATGASPTSGPDRNMMAFGPGQHLVVYSAQGLELALRRAGFTEVEVAETSGGVHLLAGASMTPGAIDLGARLDRRKFAAWLASRAGEVEDAETRIGYLGRWLKLSVAGGDWVGAEAALARVTDEFRRLGYDLDRPDELQPPLAPGFVAFAPLAPCNAASVLFQAGRLAEQASSAQRARACFAACIRFGDALNLRLAEVPALDLETAECVEAARGRVAVWTIPHDPAGAADLFAGLAAQSPASVPTLPWPTAAHALLQAVAQGLAVQPLEGVFADHLAVMDRSTRLAVCTAFADAAQRSGRPRDERRWGLEAAEADRANRTAWLERAAAAAVRAVVEAADLGRLDEAVDLLAGLPADREDDPLLRRTRALIALNRDGDPEAALRWAEPVAGAEDVADMARVQLFMRAVSSGDAPAARTLLPRLSGRALHDAGAQLALGLYHLNIEDEPARAGLHLCASTDPAAEGLRRLAALRSFVSGCLSGRFSAVEAFSPQAEQAALAGPAALEPRLLARLTVALAVRAWLHEKSASRARDFAARAQAFELPEDLRHLLSGVDQAAAACRT